jgi:imidazole glycerol-phosphate synthase subunit HisH
VNVAVCDYGAGNVRSVLTALERIGAPGELTADPDLVAAADVAILPGVGSAGSAMAALRRTGIAEALRRRRGRTLAICLGLQLALEHTEEDGGVDGLGLLPGRAVRLEEGRVPRIGWAEVEQVAQSHNVPRPTYWFAHSYAAETTAATAVSEGVVAEARSGAFVGCQFHPERSGPAGLRYLERCLSLV